MYIFLFRDFFILLFDIIVLISSLFRDMEIIMYKAGMQIFQ